MVPQTSNGHPVFDVFPFKENYECPWSKARIAAYQKRINTITGLSSNGRPNVRLIWPGDTDESVSMHTINGEKRARYRLWTDTYRCTRIDADSGLEIVEDIDVDIVFPRFVLEQFHEPQEEAFNPSVHGITGDGYYTHLFTVSHHSEKCCNGREAKNGRLCLGLYHEPNYLTIEELQRRIQERDAQKHGHRPGEHISEDEYVEDREELREWKVKRDEHLHSAYLHAARQSLATHGWRLFNHDPGKKSKYI